MSSPLLELIQKSHEEPSNDALQEKVLQDIFKYLSQLDATRHLFCDETISPIAIHGLVLFSFADTEVLTWYKSKISNCLDNCRKCIRKFHCGRAKLRQDFTVKRGIPYNSVKNFNDIIFQWEAERILNSTAKQQSLSDNSVYECLQGPGMLRVNPRLKQFFTQRFAEMLKQKSIVIDPVDTQDIPGLIYLLFEGNTIERNWALELLNSDFFQEFKDFNEAMVEEYSIHLWNIQNPIFYNDDNCIKFWLNLKPILLKSPKEIIEFKFLKPIDLDSIQKVVDFQVVPLYKVLSNQIMSFLDTPLPILLQIFHIFLLKLQKKFWSYVSPFIFTNFLDPILENPNFAKYLSKAPTSNDNSIYNISDMLVWFQSLYQSLELVSSSQQQQAGVKISIYLLNHINDPQVGFILNHALSIMIQCSNITKKLYEPQLSLDLLLKTDIRNTILKKHVLLVDIAVGGKNFNPNEKEVTVDQIKNPLRAKAILIIKNSLKYDVLLYSQNSYLLRQNFKKISSNTMLNFNSEFWDYVCSKLVRNDVPFAIEILSVFKSICGIVEIDIKKLPNKADAAIDNSESIKFYNNSIKVLYQNLSVLLFKLNDFDPYALKKILANPEASEGFWSCTLSHNSQVYQSAVNILYDTFDVEGRLEGTRSILKLNALSCLSSISENLKTLSFLQFYEPCPRTVRVLMDIIQSLNDPLNGLFVDSNEIFNESGLKSTLKLFWNDCWHFLDVIYRETLHWATQYPQAILVDFTRDVLDLSHLLIDCFKQLETVVSSDNHEANNNDFSNSTLFDAVMKTFPNMLVWLRLGDDSLLSSCVTLIFKTLDLANDLHLPFDREIIVLLAKNGAKAKKFNNKLTQKQRSEILDRARSFDEDLVDSIIQEAEEYRNSTSLKRIQLQKQEEEEDEKNKKTRSLDNLKTSSPEVIEISDNEQFNNVSARKVKQSDLSKYLIQSSAPPSVPPSVAQKQIQKNSMLLAAKQSLANKRKEALKPLPSSTAPPAPPRPSGFNRKRHLAGRSATPASDSSSDSEFDSDNDVNNLFNLPDSNDRIKDRSKFKLKTKADHAKGLIAPRQSALKKSSSKNEMSQKEKDEFNMRMRLNVDMNPLYNKILSWSYSRIDSFPEDFEPGINSAEDVYKKIKDTFESVQDYQNTFEPLLLLECWQSIQQSKEIGQETPFKVIIGTRTTTDYFFEVYASIKKDVIYDRKIGESDMIVLSYIPENLMNNSKDGLPSRNAVKNSTDCCLAKIKEIKNVNAEFSDVTLRVSIKNNRLTSFLTPRTELIGMKVIQMITLEREFSSLVGLQYYDLSNEIVKAIPNVPKELNLSETEKMKQIYGVNDSQAAAIAGAADSQGFSLIQGPPGTGKTKTILGVVGHILSSTKPSSAQRINIPRTRPGVTENNKPEQAVQKILVCAPSNAAVDELVLRLRLGVKDSTGADFNPKVVRLGRSDAINSAVRDLTLEELVESELQAGESNSTLSADPKIRQEHTECIQERNRIREELRNNPDIPSERIEELNQKLKRCVQRKNELGKQLDEQREKVSISHRNREILRRTIQARILSEAQIICSTLSGSAHDFLASLAIKFDSVIVDEAAQCIELSAIIPLRYGSKKCIMVGDPNQLPPTVLSQAAASYKYEQSLFVRMQKNYPKSVYLLNTQYRMHPDISKFPSFEFYDSKLIDGPNMAEVNARPWHVQNYLKPYEFFDIVTGRQEQSSLTRSLFNITEAKIALELVSQLFESYSNDNWTGRIGIISPYKEQVRTIKDCFTRKYGKTILREIDFNTVDGFQGQEKEIIIMSCVRASNDQNGVGFLSDVRRMNVGLTRARTSLWILGNSNSLIQNKIWRSLINDANDRGLLVQASPGFTKRSPISKYEDRISPSIEKTIGIDRSLLKPATSSESPYSINARDLQLNKSENSSKALSKNVLQKEDMSKKKAKNRVTVPFNKKRRVISSDTIKEIKAHPSHSDKKSGDSSRLEHSSGQLPPKAAGPENAPAKSVVGQQNIQPDSIKIGRDEGHSITFSSSASITSNKEDSNQAPNIAYGNNNRVSNSSTSASISGSIPPRPANQLHQLNVSKAKSGTLPPPIHSAAHNVSSSILRTNERTSTGNKLLNEGSYNGNQNISGRTHNESMKHNHSTNNFPMIYTGNYSNVVPISNQQNAEFHANSLNPYSDSFSSETINNSVNKKYFPKNNIGKLYDYDKYKNNIHSSGNSSDATRKVSGTLPPRGSDVQDSGQHRSQNKHKNLSHPRRR
ncbi:hypothetical protein PACTADRAFT_51485 [Pachysolen tannophilus NRRL Y-2460]|uniref:UvrD-like helicase ATP-binding domain-containing protein n=1 Tax=Pachysolen tannophilus NRRL Y-2460 TaxID=669874 RepID=A0A1E4TPN4_PACTA|nr:hypothetical protein PACTADRAFT_51485 [Pachysolen tannophilus NRRL Y-2460]